MPPAASPSPSDACAPLRGCEGREEGAPPPVDLAAERRNGDLIRRLISAHLVTACHDVSDGGLLVAVAEMALAGDVGATLETPADEIAPHAWLFGEDQGRYVVTTGDAQAVLTAAAAAGVPAQTIGRTDGWSLTVGHGCTISITELRAAHEAWMPDYMAAP